MDRIEELAIFVAIVDAGSLAGAARRLRKSRPAGERAGGGGGGRGGAPQNARAPTRPTPAPRGSVRRP